MTAFIVIGERVVSTLDISTGQGVVEAIQFAVALKKPTVSLHRKGHAQFTDETNNVRLIVDDGK